MHENIGCFLTRRARRDPDLEALVEPATGRRFSYAELNSRCNQTAHGLLELGVSQGDRVALLLMNGVEFSESFFSAAKVGAVNVPLNWRLVADELEFILTDAGATLLIYGAEFAENVEILRSRGKTAIEHWIQVGGETAAGSRDYDEWMGAASTAEPEATACGDDLVFLMYTSGTTGLPKGVMHSHETVFWMTQTMTNTADICYRDRYLNSLPLFHVGALSPVIGCFFRGSTVVIMKAFDPSQAWELIRDEKITTTLMVPAMLQFMLGVRDAETHDFSTLRWVMSGAAPVPVTLIHAYLALGIEIQQVYGLTETCGPACLSLAGDDGAKAGSTGRAFFYTEVRVVREDGSDTDPGEGGGGLGQGPAHHVGLLEAPRGHGREPGRRLAPHRGCGNRGRGWIRDDRRSCEGYVDLRGGERLPGGNREYPAEQREGGGCGCDRDSLEDLGRVAPGGCGGRG